MNNVFFPKQVMFLCDKCWSKRCPHATDKKHKCTNSNEPGQAVSRYTMSPIERSDRMDEINRA